MGIMDQEALVLQGPEKALSPRPPQSQALPMTALQMLPRQMIAPLVLVQQLALVLVPLLSLVS